MVSHLNHFSEAASNILAPHKSWHNDRGLLVIIVPS